MDIHQIFLWIEGTQISRHIGSSTLIFPIVEAIHLVALALVGGSVLMVDLRLLGLGLTAARLSVLEREARRWLIASVAVMVATGSVLFLAEPLKLYDSGAFWVKMTTLVVVLLYAFLVRRPFARRDLPADWRSKAVGLISMSLWFVVAAAGRWIGWGG